LSNCKWHLSDLTKKNLSLQCSVPQNTPNGLLTWVSYLYMQGALPPRRCIHWCQGESTRTTMQQQSWLLF
jgi:hypothetical protein